MTRSHNLFIAFISITLYPQLALNAHSINSYSLKGNKSLDSDIPRLIEANLNMHSLTPVKRSRIHNQFYDLIGIEIKKSKINFLYPEKKIAIESENIRHLYKSIMNSQINDFKNSNNILNHQSLIID